VKKVENNKDIARLMFASVTRPINAALAGAGTLFVVAGVTNHPLGLLGAALLLGTTYSMGRDLSSKEFVSEVLEEGTPMKALPEIPDSLAGQYRLQCLEAKRHMEKTIEAIESGGPEMAPDLMAMRDQIVESVESVYRFAGRAHHIDGILTASSRNEINKEIEKIRAQLVLATDPETRMHLEGTLEQKAEQLKNYDELALMVKRIQAQMQYVNASLENVQFKVLKLVSTAEFRLGPGQTDEVTASLQNLLHDVKNFERSLEDAYADKPSLRSGTIQAWDEQLEQRNRLPSGLHAEGAGSERDSLAAGHSADGLSDLPRKPDDSSTSPAPGS